MSTYPRDEFDAVPESPRRQGVHRTRSTEPRRGLGWIMAAGIVALMIGAAAFFLMPRLADTSATAGGPAPSSAPSAASTPTEASPSPSATPTEANPSPSPTEAAPTATAASASSVNRTLEVGVYNSTGTAGLAARVGDQARAAGWAVSSVGNWSGGPVNTSIVFYRSAAEAASAQALAADLGIPTVLEAPGLGVPLAAVVGPGYAG